MYPISGKPILSTGYLFLHAVVKGRALRFNSIASRTGFKLKLWLALGL